MQVDTLDRALVVLKRGQTFMQSKSMSADLQKIATGLKSIVQATWVNAKQKAMVQSLLQSEDEDLSLQPQATTAACAAALSKTPAESRGMVGGVGVCCSGALSPTRTVVLGCKQNVRASLKTRSTGVRERSIPRIATQSVACFGITGRRESEL